MVPYAIPNLVHSYLLLLLQQEKMELTSNRYARAKHICGRGERGHILRQDTVEIHLTKLSKKKKKKRKLASNFFLIERDTAAVLFLSRKKN